ncbi:hypothetical protein PR202_ga20351 [Eleusine coracana subsp. coracana]|uniref:Uncharacterized protein n=1 Tax=Eleusine coracana subsp. coracana TaxID=191504 RepID=A0AAV5CY80_ELECO|nr:hypothetical protein PR202_ga20351 [Eleusine coracana subsp. coracana]
MSDPAAAITTGGGERRATTTVACGCGVFRFADWVDVLLMALGTLGAIADGCSYNLLLVFLSDVVNSLGARRRRAHPCSSSRRLSCLDFVYLALAILPVAFLEGYCWSKTSERQVRRMRYLHLQAMLRQEVAFFHSGEATTSETVDSISRDAYLIQEVLAEKVPLFLMHSTAFISGLAFSAYFSWRLALVSFPLVLLLIIPGVIYGKYLASLTVQSRREYAKANSQVEQALGSIKTVYAFTAEKRIIQRYKTVLDNTIKLGIKQGIAKGLAVGCTSIAFAIWAFLSWYGSRLVVYHNESGGRIYAAGLSFVLGGLSLGMALPELKHFTEASSAATKILKQGEIEFKSVSFAYPLRPEMAVLKDFNLHIPAGKTVALVGSSGSGKSTSIALVQRFYDATEGSIKIDGIGIKELQLKWIRSKIGLVSQDHALFGTSIKENILFGKPDATIDEIYAAATIANAHSFIIGLPEEYETKIGEHGALLSGGQKQRISIARAVIKKPAILLLDEATSALDSESEKLVQNALDKASIGRTTLIVAHKLSTVMNADQIAVIDGGRIAELGGMVAAFFVQDRSEMNAIIGRYAMILCSLSLISILVNLLEHYNFAYMGVHLVRRIRLQVLEKILTFEAAWFDEETNSSGSLCSQLSDEASLVKTLVADRISLLLQIASGITIAVTMGLILAWKLAVVMIAVEPSTMICYYAKMVILANVSRDLVKAQHQSTQIAIEAVRNHMMVTSFGCSLKVLQLFDKTQEEPLRKLRKKSLVAGISTGLSPCLLFLSRALEFWYAGTLVQSREISAADAFKTYFVLMTTGNLIAEAGSMTSDLAKGANAVTSVFKVLDRKSICLESNLEIDGMDVRDMDIIWYRGFTALVSQDPAIFSGSIRDNIAIGKPDANEDEIVDAAKAANAHEFISTLKDGYDTDCGERSIQLSGGQKQRIAIARAMIRNPTILLLDEATSALDPQSELVVQEALNRIVSGRTTILVAHRLNTIRNVDSIAFLGEGKVVELGTYPELMKKKGSFYNLANLQG